MLSARKQPTAAHERRRKLIACSGGQSARAACDDLLLRRGAMTPLPDGGSAAGVARTVRARAAAAGVN